MNATKDKYVINLLEDDRKVSASSPLKSELDIQYKRWRQWESLNVTISSKNGAIFGCLRKA
ncbi:hypothetical protein METHB2_270041 [Candidatus Methylobacter favarea]|uniref:Uncharacterized protein n=1 Tax=Candidatus Methylobacter favarea TaxID=2707345 RepID=A0A8S0Y9V7_9GAMM|nr:hypothetical protein [Candidatus Methylobacter favarea]CAA9890711.1 hypothetical protein METHB2_270041 [Candidatus Methylobacter favarea]